MPTQFTWCRIIENADFAEMVEEHGLAFVGPSPIIFGPWATKSKRCHHQAAVVPGSDGSITSDAEARDR